MRRGEVKFELEWAGKIALMRVRGFIHIDNSPEVRKAIEQLVKKRVPAIVLSMDDAEYVDTSGVATFIECAQNMAHYGGKLLISGITDQVAESFALSQVKESFTIFKTEADALAELRRPGAGQVSEEPQAAEEKH